MGWTLITALYNKREPKRIGLALSFPLSQLLSFLFFIISVWNGVLKPVW